MISNPRFQHSLEVLEGRIAPASLITQAHVVPAIVDTPILLHAGDLLNTGATLQGGTFLLYVEKGDALVFTTDMNNNGVVDFNEITGISAGSGLRMVSFVDIHGDIVTNLNGNFTLTDSDNNSANDDPFLKGDGRVLRNATIEKIELRSLTEEDVVDSNGDGAVDERDVTQHLALSSYSLFGSVYAGGGFGLAGDLTSGLIVDDAGRTLQSVVFGTPLGFDLFIDFKSVVGSIKVGTATNGNYYSFGVSRGNDSQGYLGTFIPPDGQVGGGVFNVRGATPTTEFNLDAVMAGDGGRGAKGGNVENVALASDTAGGYVIQAGNGGPGANGGDGGSIVNFSDSGSYTSQIVIRSGDGGTGTTGVGGNGGTASFGTMNLNGGLGITLGSGGDGFTAGGTGASIGKGVFTTPTGSDSAGNTVRGSVHVPGQIGSSGILDFDHDGIGDVVFTSFNPNQLVVELSSTGGRIQLFGVGSADALSAGDLNGDGFADIVTGSHEEGNFDGVITFLAKTEDANHDGILGQGEDLNRNGVIDFVGFEAPVRSPLVSLYQGSSPFSADYIYRRTATPITDIAIGDFNGDGNAEVAVSATYISQAISQQKVQVLLFLSPDLEEISPGVVRPTGQFFADVGTKPTAFPPDPGSSLVPFTRLNLANEGDSTEAVIQASALSTGALNDVIVGRSVGKGNNVFVIDNSVPSDIGPTVTPSALPQVDTSRGNGVNLQDVSMRDLVISDTNNDGNADLTVISESPNNYLVAKLGDGIGFPTALVGGGGDDTGALLDDFIDPDSDSVIIRATGTPGIPATDTTPATPPVFDQVVIMFSNNNSGTIQFAIADAAGGGNGNGQLTAGPTVNIGGSAMDTFFPGGLEAPFGNFAIESLGVALPRLTVVDDGFGSLLADHTVNIFAGNGGSALVGRGGNAGSIGSDLQRVDTVDPVTGAVTTDLIGSISIGISSSGTDDGFVSVIAGTGGN
ncbi:MAG: FG-GAP repeat protein, partial [Chthoniobacteraceae bacterium]